MVLEKTLESPLDCKVLSTCEYLILAQGMKKCELEVAVMVVLWLWWWW